MVRVGATVTTRYFGGYERVEIIDADGENFLVSRFSGQGTDVMPKDKIEKVLRDGPESSARH